MTDIGYVAGLLEGEGTFGKHGGSIGLIVSMTDREPIEKIAALLKRPVYLGKFLPSGKQVYITSATGNNAAAWMMTIYPLMSPRRQAKIRTMLAVWKAQPGVLPARTPTCHPKRKHLSRGFCGSCYHRWHMDNKVNGTVKHIPVEIHIR